MLIFKRNYIPFLISLFIYITSLAAKEPTVVGDTLVFSLPDLDGSMVSSSDPRFKNKVVFVTIWGTWCPPCLSEVPTFIDLQDKYREDGLIIVGIAFERDTLASMRQQGLRKFLQKKQINYLILDGGNTTEFSQALPMVVDVKGLPIEIVIDRSGRVVGSRNGYGYNEEWAEDLENELKMLLLWQK